MSVELAQKFCTLSKMDGALTRMMKGMFHPMAEDDKEAIELMNKVVEDAVPFYSERIVVVFSEIFSTEELEQLIAYIESPLGQKEIQYRELIEFKGGNIIKEAIEYAFKKHGIEV